jgi:hypothetical protein
MTNEKKRTSMRTCKHMDGDTKCTKFVQWKGGNKGCYCHKHFRMMDQNNDQRGSAITMTEANINSIAINDISQNALINEQQNPQIVVTLPVCAPTNSNCVQENSAVPQPNNNENNVDVSFSHSVTSTNVEQELNDNIKKVVKKLLKNRDKEVNALKRKVNELNNECSALKRTNERMLGFSDGLSNVLKEYITQQTRDG